MCWRLLAVLDGSVCPQSAVTACVCGDACLAYVAGAVKLGMAWIDFCVRRGMMGWHRYATLSCLCL